jgi:hypothetical protein
MTNSSTDPAVEKASIIRTWTTVEERECLARLAREVPTGGTILEIGCLYGGTTAVLALANPDARIYSIDDFGWQPEGESPSNESVLRENLARLGIANHHLIIGDSRELWKTWIGPIDLLWIDGLHVREYVESDLKYFGVLAQVVALHDYGEWWPDVQAVVNEYVRMGLWRLSEVANMVAVLRKVGPHPFREDEDRVFGLPSDPF